MKNMETKNVKASWTAPAREIARCCSVGCKFRPQSTICPGK